MMSWRYWNAYCFFWTCREKSGSWSLSPWKCPLEGYIPHVQTNQDAVSVILMLSTEETWERHTFRGGPSSIAHGFLYLCSLKSIHWYASMKNDHLNKMCLSPECQSRVWWNPYHAHLKYDVNSCAKTSEKICVFGVPGFGNDGCIDACSVKGNRKKISPQRMARPATSAIRHGGMVLFSLVFLQTTRLLVRKNMCHNFLHFLWLL